MRLRSGVVVVRDANEMDAHLLSSWWANGKVMEHAGYPDGIRKDPLELAAELRAESALIQPLRRRLMIEFGGVPIGEMNYRIEAKVAEIGVKICDFSYHGMGIGPQALVVLIEYLFDQRDLEKIVLDTMIENVRAQHVYEKLGFRKLAVNKDCWTDQRGRKRTSVDYELSRTAFEAVRRAMRLNEH
ncbi:MAG: GNAT family protein [Candidatus Izemoplasmatales bacterium]